MHDIKTVGIIAKPHVEQGARVIPGVVDWLKHRVPAVRFDRVTAGYLGTEGGEPRPGTGALKYSQTCCTLLTNPIRRSGGGYMKDRLVCTLCILVSGCLAPVLEIAAPSPAALPAGPGQQGTKQGAGLRLEDGTPIKLRLQRTISSADARVDERVDFDVLEEIKVAELVVIPKGSTAWGTVTEAQPKRRMGKGGKLDVNIDAVRLANGDKAALRGSKDVKGGGHTGAMTGAIVATSLIVWPAAPFFLFMHGKDVTIPKGTELDVYVNGDVTIDPAKFGGSAAQTSVQSQKAGPEASQPVGEPSTVVVKSMPDGADVTVDGKYMGSTPSTLRLAPGDHSVLIEKSGFKAWQRTMTMGAGGIVTVDATLEKVL